MIGFCPRLRDFIEVSGTGTSKQRTQNCKDYVSESIDNFKRVDYFTDHGSHRKSLYLFSHRDKIHICSYDYSRPPKWLSVKSWDAYEFSKVIEEAVSFETKEEAIEWVQQIGKKRVHNSPTGPEWRGGRVGREYAWNDKNNHVYMRTQDAVKEIEDFEL